MNKTTSKKKSQHPAKKQTKPKTTANKSQHNPPKQAAKSIEKFGITIPFPPPSLVISAASAALSAILFTLSLFFPAVYVPAVVYAVLTTLLLYLAWITANSVAHGLTPAAQIALCLFLSIIGFILHLVFMANHPVKDTVKNVKHKKDEKERIVRCYFAGRYIGIATLLSAVMMVATIIVGNL